MFEGFLDEGQAGSLTVQIESSGAPIEPDASPTFRVYGKDGAIANGSGTASSLESGNVTGATNASPVEITAAAHGLLTGQRVTISSVGGNSGANGTFTITKTGTDTFTLDGSTGTGSYTSGGAWKTTGLYKMSISGSMLSSLSSGSTYMAVMYYSISSAAKVRSVTFTVR